MTPRMPYINAGHPNMVKFRINPRIMALLESVEGFSEAEALADEADLMVTDLEAQRPGPIALAEVLDAGKLPEGWIDSAGVQLVKADVLERKISLARDLRSAAADRIEQAAMLAIDDILIGLNAQLQDLVTRLVPIVEALGDVNNPLEAIERGRADDWKALTEVRAEYHQLRASQTAVTSSELAYSSRARADIRDPHASDMIVRNMDDVWPTGRVHRYHGAIHRDGFSYDTPPWPEDTEQFLIWCMKNNAELWVPTETELAAMPAKRNAWVQSEANRVFSEAGRNPDKVSDMAFSGQVPPLVQQELLGRGAM